jgi:hypothetical protein
MKTKLQTINEQELQQILNVNNLDEILLSEELKNIFSKAIKELFKELIVDDSYVDELFNFDYSKKFNSENYHELDNLLETIKLDNIDKLPQFIFTFKPTGTATLSLSKHAISFNKVKFDSPIKLTLLDLSINKGEFAKVLGETSYICIDKDNPYKIFFHSIDIEKFEKI